MHKSQGISMDINWTPPTSSFSHDSMRSILCMWIRRYYVSRWDLLRLADDTRYLINVLFREQWSLGVLHLTRGTSSVTVRLNPLAHSLGIVAKKTSVALSTILTPNCAEQNA
jgi:hypothetical protein